MRVYVADAFALLHILDYHIFEQNRLSGAGLANQVKMPSSVVVFHIYQRLVASVKILAQQNSLLGQVERRRSVFGFDIFELGNGRNAFGKMENSGRFGRVEAKGFILVKKAEREFIKKVVQFLALHTSEVQSVALRFGKLHKGAFNFLQNIVRFILAVGGNKNSQIGRHQRMGSFFLNHFGQVFVGRSFLLLFFSYSGSSFWEEESEKIKSPMKEKMPVPVILAFFKASKSFFPFLISSAVFLIFLP